MILARESVAIDKPNSSPKLLEHLPNQIPLFEIVTEVKLKLISSYRSYICTTVTGIDVVLIFGDFARVCNIKRN